MLVGFDDSYLGGLRKQVGNQLVLMPAASVLVLDVDGRVLLQHRSDDGSWCLPGGAAEVGSSFLRTALAELHEETGIEASPDDLVAFPVDRFA